jgi:hypothetical protein
VELNGVDADRQVWKQLLLPQGDPYVEEVTAGDVSFLVLRSTAFDALGSASEVHERAKAVFQRLNMAMAANVDVDPVAAGAVVEFAEEGAPRRHHFMEAETIVSRARIFMPTVTVMDARGNAVQRPPAGSIPQQWMRAAALHSSISHAMNYLVGSPGWVNLYKCYEVLRDSNLAKKTISEKKLRNFTHTANTDERHREGMFNPPLQPMPMWEGRSLMMSWLTAAIDEVLKANP